MHAQWRCTRTRASPDLTLQECGSGWPVASIHGYACLSPSLSSSSSSVCSLFLPSPQLKIAMAPNQKNHTHIHDVLLHIDDRSSSTFPSVDLVVCYPHHSSSSGSTISPWRFIHSDDARTLCVCVWSVWSSDHCTSGCCHREIKIKVTFPTSQSFLFVCSLANDGALLQHDACIQQFGRAS